MATATMPRVGDTIKLDGEPQTFALRFIEGKSVASRFPGGRVMFTCIDERKLFMNDEEASEFEHALIEQGIRKAEFIRVSRVTHGRGGGFSIRVERVGEPDDNAPAWVRGDNPDTHPDTHPDTRHAVRKPAQSREEARAAVPTREEALLEKSIELARERGAAAFQRTPSRVSPEPPPAPAVAQNGRIHDTAAPAEPASAAGSMSKLLTGALVASIKGYLEAVELAKAQGIPCSIAPLEFTAEDIRQSATSMLIEYWRSGGTR